MPVAYRVIKSKDPFSFLCPRLKTIHNTKRKYNCLFKHTSIKMLHHKKTIQVLLLFFLTGMCTIPLSAQTKQTSCFIGLNPGITIEPYYEKGELDLNIFPLVFQNQITNRTDLRLTSILNLGIRQTGNQISHFGIEMAFPAFFKKKANKSECSKGFF